MTVETAIENARAFADQTRGWLLGVRMVPIDGNIRSITTGRSLTVWLFIRIVWSEQCSESAAELELRASALGFQRRVIKDGIGEELTALAELSPAELA